MDIGAAGRLIVLTGPPGSGKTTTALAWSMVRSRPTFALDWDAAHSTLLAARELGYACLPTDAQDQYRLAAGVVAAQAEWITGAGNDCIVACAWVPNAPPPYDVWAALERLQPLVVVLLPDEEACVRRNAADPARQGRFGVGEEHVRGSYRLRWSDWHAVPGAVVLDSSALDRAATVAALEAAVRTATG